jgi:hypothetical protein
MEYEEEDHGKIYISDKGGSKGTENTAFWPTERKEGKGTKAWSCARCT